MGSPMQIAFLTEQFFRSKPVSCAFSAMTRRNEGTPTMAVGSERSIISNTSIGEEGPTRKMEHPISRSPSQYARPAMKHRSKATATKTVSLAVSPAHSNDKPSFKARRRMSEYDRQTRRIDS